MPQAFLQINLEDQFIDADDIARFASNVIRVDE
jgi:hypothetical protein